MARRTTRVASLPRIVTYSEAESLLTISRSSLKRLIASGDLEVVEVTPGARRVVYASLVDYLRRRLGS